ncbi:MAG: hypothetical protein ABS882_07970 [Lysinibacillus sp.]
MAFLLFFAFSADDTSANVNVAKSKGIIVEKSRIEKFSYSQGNWSQIESTYYLKKNEAVVFAKDLENKAKKLKNAQKVLKKLKVNRTKSGKVLYYSLSLKAGLTKQLAKDIIATTKTGKGHVKFTYIDNRYSTLTSKVTSWNGTSLDLSTYDKKTKKNNVTQHSILKVNDIYSW